MGRQKVESITRTNRAFNNIHSLCFSESPVRPEKFPECVADEIIRFRFIGIIIFSEKNVTTTTGGRRKGILGTNRMYQKWLYRMNSFTSSLLKARRNF